MTDRYVVVGQPVEHSKSPFIHTAFARQTGERLEYGRLAPAVADFEEAVSDFFAMGGAGCNVTVPFKARAAQLANRLTERAARAGAVNTLWLDDEGLVGDNTDGVGLLRDLARHIDLNGRRVLLIGAGGAARGVLGPLCVAAPARLVIANRTPEKAAWLATLGADASLQPEGCGLEALQGETFDVVINASSASLQGEALALPDGLIADGGLAYDMMYGAAPTPFLAWAAGQGARTVDGLGMLVEQAAEAFFCWRGKRPETAPVLADLRAQWSGRTAVAQHPTLKA
jgi:shikimate dehydrogenase